MTLPNIGMIKLQSFATLNWPSNRAYGAISSMTARCYEISERVRGALKNYSASLARFETTMIFDVADSKDEFVNLHPVWLAKTNFCQIDLSAPLNYSRRFDPVVTTVLELDDRKQKNEHKLTTGSYS